MACNSASPRGAGLGDLAVDQGVERLLLDGAEHAHRLGEIGLGHVAQEKTDGGDWLPFIVDEQIGGSGVADVDDQRLKAVIQADALVAILAEDQRLAVFELDNRIGLRSLSVA